MTTTLPAGRFGAVKLEDEKIVGFEEKPQGDKGMINGGFFIFSPKVLTYIDGDHSSLEGDFLQRLVEADELRAWKHQGFWQPMDTMREKQQLEELWQTGQAPWKQWD
jgi:glucose-1-phosphate cytidylyltransferase